MHKTTTKTFIPLPLLLVSGLLISVTSYHLQFVKQLDAVKIFSWWGVFCSLVYFGFYGKSFQRIQFFVYVLFGLDIAIIGVIRRFFGIYPNPSVIIDTLMNTQAGEVHEFIQGHAHLITEATLFFIGTVLMGVLCLKNISHPTPSSPPQTIRKCVGLFFLLLFIAINFNPTMRRQNPLLRWVDLIERSQSAQNEISNMSATVIAARQQASNSSLDAHTTPRTLVLVIGESNNRNNWSLYGYPRPTTEPLEKEISKGNGTFHLFKNTWSSAPSTLPSLQQALTPASLNDLDAWRTAPDVLGLAHANGYHITWLSNQMKNEGWFDAISQVSDERQFINNGDWRDSSTFDRDLLPLLEHRLNQSHPQELIVIHLLGQHVLYDQRCPAEQKPFSNLNNDSVMQNMRARGFSSDIQSKRNNYDNAVYCGADVLARIIQTVTDKRENQATAVLFFSDHGQEVGHYRDFAGHSSVDSSGYAIPMFVWLNPKWAESQQQFSFVDKPFRLDWMDNTIQNLLGIQSPWYHEALDILSPNYNPTETVEPRLSEQ